MIIIRDIEQGTPEWDQLRLGIPTSSKFGDIITSDGKHSKSRQAYLYRLAGERITGQIYKGWHGDVYDRGHEMEPEIRETYEFIKDCHVETVAFIYKDEKRRFGVSPDGIMIDLKGGFEAKSAAPNVQAERLHKGWTGAEHHRQVMGCLLATGFEWWDLVSYCPGMKPVIERFYRDEEFLKILEDEINIFCDELDEIVKAIS